MSRYSKDHLTDTKEVRRLALFEYLKRMNLQPPNVTQMWEYLTANGYQVTTRTVRRDMEYFLNNDLEYDISVTINSGVPHYQMNENCTYFHNIKLDDTDINTIFVALSSLETNAPNALKQMAKKARQSLLGAIPRDGQRVFKEFDKKFHFLYGENGRAKNRNEKAISICMDALRLDQIVIFDYLKAKKDKVEVERNRRFAPLLFVMAGNKTFLYGKDLDKDDQRIFNLSRILKAEMSDEKHGFRVSKEDISNLNMSVAGFGIGMPDSELVEYRIKGNRYFYETMCEFEFHPSQKIEKIDDETYLLSFISTPSSSFDNHFNKKTPGVISIEKNKPKK